MAARHVRRTRDVSDVGIPASASGPWPAPAKLNLFLHITGRRADGYHELQTLFQFLTYGDWLYFDIHDGEDIALCGTPAGVPQADDLCVKAAHLLREAAGRAAGVTIYNDKRTPPGSGLGGGSSDAATTLIVLNKLWRLGLETRQLAALGLRLGADVPVFIHGHSAWAEGVGEILTPVSSAGRLVSGRDSTGKRFNCRYFFRRGIDTGHAADENTRPCFGLRPKRLRGTGSTQVPGSCSGTRLAGSIFSGKHDRYGWKRVRRL